MKTALTIFVALLLFSVVAVAQDPTPTPSPSDEQKIRDLEAEYVDDFNKKDWDAVAKLIAETYTVRDENGKVSASTKHSTMESLRNGTREYSNMATSAIEVTVSGDIAKVSGNLFRELRDTKSGAAGTQEGKFFRTWKRTADGWQIAEYQLIAKIVETSRGIETPEIRMVNATTLTSPSPFLPPDILLNIYGRGFGGSGATVIVNGHDVSRAINLQTSTHIGLRGTKGGLKLNSKSENTVTVYANGKSSVTYTFTQRF